MWGTGVISALLYTMECDPLLGSPEMTVLLACRSLVCDFYSPFINASVCAREHSGVCTGYVTHLAMLPVAHMDFALLNTIGD